MSEKLINETQLRMAAERAKQLSAQVAQSAAEAIEEVSAGAVTMEQVNAAIQAAGGGGSGGSAGEIYSTEERVIGRWIDNRPLYRKTFEKEGFNIFGKNIWTLIDMQGCKIHRWHGYIDDGYSQFPLNFNISDINLESQFGTENYIMTCIEESGQALVLQSGLNTSMSNVSIVFTVEYTRNADQPVSTADGEQTRRITLAADPPVGGAVSGGGVVSDGMTVTVTAQPNENENYYFDGWKEDGAVVETEQAYTFPVTAGRALTAAFLQSQYEAGVDWWESTLPSSASWTGVAYGDGKFVAVAYTTNKVAYSTDGITWTSASIPSTGYNYWNSVTYGDGKFVAVEGNSNKAAYSMDGITWTEVTLPSSANWTSVTYGDGKFVAVAFSSSKAAYSTDGITWTEAALPSYTFWKHVTYGDDKFVAVGKNSSKATYSTDGITWTEVTLPSSANWTSVTYGDGKFVAVAANSDKAACSTDGITWAEATLPSSAAWKSVIYGNGKFVTVVESSDKAAYSTDGITWTEVTLPSSAKWYSITYGNGKFVAVAENGNKAAYSSAKGPGA